MKTLFALIALLFLSAAVLASSSIEETLADEVATALFEEESDSESANSCAVGWAQKQIGKGYSQQDRYGPNSFDCSGLIYMAYKNCGKTVPTWTGAYPGGLQQVSQSNMQPGDILWRSGHVALYVGSGQIVHAINSKYGVKQTAITGGWFGTVEKVFRP